MNTSISNASIAGERQSGMAQHASPAGHIGNALKVFYVELGRAVAIAMDLADAELAQQGN